MLNNLLHSAYNKEGLTLEQVRAVAPSVFAGDKAPDRSARYTFIPTSRVLERLVHEGFYPVFAGQSKARSADGREFAKHVIRFRSRHYMAPKEVGDIIPEGILTNSHDGSSGYILGLGLYRVWCSNGAVAKLGEGQEYRVRHTGDIVDNVIDATYRVVEDFPMIVDKAREWQSIPVPMDRALTYAGQALALRWDSTEEAPASPEAFLTARRYEDRDMNLWTVFNRVQENIMRGKPSYVSRRNLRYNPETRRVRSWRGVSSVHEDLRINRELWSLTDATARELASV